MSQPANSCLGLCHVQSRRPFLTTCEFTSSTDNVVGVLSALQHLLAVNSMNEFTPDDEHPRLDLRAAHKNICKSHLCTGPIVLGITVVFVNSTPQTNVWPATAAAKYEANLAKAGISRVQLKSDGTRWRTGGEVKGKQANGVGSQYSYTLPRNMVYPALLPTIKTYDKLPSSMVSHELSSKIRQFQLPYFSTDNARDIYTKNV